MVVSGIKPREIVKEYALELSKHINISKIILFGSAARSNMKADSDIDVIILSDSFRKMGFIKRLQLLSRARRGAARRVPMDILGYTPEEALRLSQESSMFKEVLKEGEVF